MKKAFSVLLAFLFISFYASAQDDGEKLAKSARKALVSYNIDPQGNGSKLDEAKDKIDKALQTPEAQALGSAWQTKGEIYNTITLKDMAKRTLDPKALLSGDNTVLEAFNAFKKAYELAAKKYEKQDAIKGLADNVQAGLVNMGAEKYEKKEFAKAYISFKAALESHDLLTGAGEKSILEDKETYDNTTYYTALSARLANQCKDAIPLLEKLQKAGNAKPEVYQDLYECKVTTGDEAGALQTLTEGRQKYPDDAQLLFAEINDYLKKGRLSELTGRLQKAIEKEPTNASLYLTLGGVYDNLYQKALEEKNDAEAVKNFDSAKKQYEQASKIDPKNGEVQYSLGALYYNKAALRTKELNAMPEDYSAAGLKKYETMRNEIMALFDQSLPYFQKAEAADPNDVNTLVALKEIYTRKEDDLALEFKKRLDLVQGGGKNASPYFKN